MCERRPSILLADGGMSAAEAMANALQRAGYSVAVHDAPNEPYPAEADVVVVVVPPGGERDRVLEASTRMMSEHREPTSLQLGPLLLDFAARQAFSDGQPLGLTQYEFDLLKALAEHAGQVLSREKLIQLARGTSDEAFDRSVDVHICHLRAKLGERERRDRQLQTVRGLGYRLNLP